MRAGVFAVTAALLLSACSGPALLNGADRAYGSRASMAVARDVAFGTHGQRLDVWAPRGGGRHPVVIFFYGGSWESGRRQDYGFAGRAFASQGFVTVVPDYRKSPEAVFPAFVEDAAQAVRWAHDNAARLGGDGDAIVLSGHSAGAHIAALVALDRHWLADAGVPARAIRGVVGISGPYDFLPLTTAAAQRALGQWPKLAETQPISFARADAPPMLLLTGDKDVTVRPRNSAALAAALTAKGASARVIAYPGVTHIGAVLALSQPFKGRAPVLRDASDAIRAWTAARG